MESWTVEDRLDTDLEGVSKVVVQIVGGDVTVTPGEPQRSEAEPPNRAHLEVVRESGAEVVVELRDGTLYVSQPDSTLAPIDRFFRYLSEGRRHKATVNITAPRTCEVDVATVSAPIVVSGFDGGTRVKTVSGDATLANLGSDVDVKMVSGDAELKNITGDLKLKAVSGDLTVVDGSCRVVDAKTVSGDILLDLDLDPTGVYDASTVSGDVSLRTTSDPHLSIDVKTVSGAFISDFGGPSETRSGARTVRQTIGDGGARLWVKTVSGNLRILRGRAAAA